MHYNVPHLTLPYSEGKTFYDYGKENYIKWGSRKIPLLIPISCMADSFIAPECTVLTEFHHSVEPNATNNAQHTKMLVSFLYLL